MHERVDSAGGEISLILLRMWLESVGWRDVRHFQNEAPPQCLIEAVLLHPSIYEERVQLHHDLAHNLAPEDQWQAKINSKPRVANMRY